MIKLLLIVMDLRNGHYVAVVILQIETIMHEGEMKCISTEEGVEILSSSQLDIVFPPNLLPSEVCCVEEGSFFLHPGLRTD